MVSCFPIARMPLTLTNCRCIQATIRSGKRELKKLLDDIAGKPKEGWAEDDPRWKEAIEALDRQLYDDIQKEPPGKHYSSQNREHSDHVDLRVEAAMRAPWRDTTIQLDLDYWGAEFPPSNFGASSSQR